MQIKRFEGTSMDEILSGVRRTLGEDALILSSRKLQKKKMGAFTEEVYEVSAAVDPSAGGRSAPPSPKPPAFETFLSLEKEISPLKEEIAGLKAFLKTVLAERDKTSAPAIQDRLDRLARDVRALHGRLDAPGTAGPPEAAPRSQRLPRAKPANDPEWGDWLVRRLILQGVDAGACGRIRDAARRRCPAADRATMAEIRKVAGTVIESAVSVEAMPGPGPRGPRILAFVGPAGSGKTTTVARTAALLARRGIRCAAICAGHAAPGTLFRLSDMLRPSRIPVLSARTDEELARAVARTLGASHVLIDVAGGLGGSARSVKTVATLFRRLASVDFCLTLPASWGGTSPSRMIRNLGPLPVRYTTFTMLDETDRFGPMFNAAATSGRPVLYLTAGRQFPGHIVPARPHMFARLLLDHSISAEGSHGR